MMLSKNLSLAEATTSQTATRLKIKNNPDNATIAKMKIVADKIFQPTRDYFNKPIRVSSFYRSKALNKAVGGSKTSQHMTGEAIDMQGTGTLTNAEIFFYIKDNLSFDQLIWEYGDNNNPAWVHASFKDEKTNRKQVLAIGVKKKF